MSLGTALMMGAAGVSGEVLDGLVGWWAHANSGDVAATGTWNDASGQGNDGTLTGDAYVDSDGLHLDGTADYAAVYTNDYKLTTSFSTACWVRATTRVTWGRIINYWTATYNGGWMLSWYGANQWYEHRLEGIDGGDGSEVTGSITLDVWYHLAGVYDSDNDLGILYVDGAEVDRQTTSGTMVYAATDMTLAIGARLPSPQEFFNGTIGDVRIYNRSLSQSEIAQIVALNKR